MLPRPIEPQVRALQETRTHERREQQRTDADRRGGAGLRFPIDVQMTNAMLVNHIGSIGTKAAPISDPFSAGEVQVAPLSADLAAFTDLYYRGYGNNYPDLFRYQEWKREWPAGSNP